MKEELGGQIMKEFARLRTKTYSYLKDNKNEDKKEKDSKRCVIKIKLKCQDYKNCLEVAQIENKINNLEKIKIDVDSIIEDQKELMKDNKLTSKTQQRFRKKSIIFLLKKLIILL